MVVKEAFPDFEKPSIAVDAVVLRTVQNDRYCEDKRIAPKRLQILLIRKAGEELWHLPGTILRLGEVPKTALNRVFNTDNMYMEQLYTMADNPMRDERGHIVSIVYIGITTTDVEVVGVESKWFDIVKPDGIMVRRFVNFDEDSVLSIQELMYDHKDIVEDALTRIKNKLMYTDIGFNFVDKEFTITELENTFTAINERNIPGFRRIIANKVTGTGKTITGKSFRPAELYIKAVKGESAKMNKIITVIVDGDEYNHTFKWNSLEEFKRDLDSGSNLPDCQAIVKEAYIDDNLVDFGNTFGTTLRKLEMILDL